MSQNEQKIGNISNSTVIGNNVSGDGVNIHHNTLPEEIAESIKKIQEQMDCLTITVNKLQEQNDNIITALNKLAIEIKMINHVKLENKDGNLTSGMSIQVVFSKKKIRQPF